MEGERVTKSKIMPFNNTQPPIIRKKSTYKGVRSHNFVFKCDFCGLKGNYDVFSDDESVVQKCNHVHTQFVKSQILNNKSITKDIQQKFDLIEEENAKTQFKIKSLYKNIIKKDKIIAELNAKNLYLKEQLKEIVKNNANHNSNLMDLANVNNRLQKEIEKKNTEISELHIKINKSEFVKSNLLKDIEFYKNELNVSQNETLNQQQKYSDKKYEELQRKFYETKIENGKLCRKFKEIRLNDEENSTKSYSHQVLCKKFETCQHDMMKLKMENTKLKDTIRKNKQTSDSEANRMVENTSKLMNKEIEKYTQIKMKLEEEIQNYKTKLEEAQLELSSTKILSNDVQSKLQKKATYGQQCEDEIKSFESICIDLENKIESLSIEKDEIIRQHFVNEENNNKLKLKLDELIHENSALKTQNVRNDEESKEVGSCENCILLKQEVEKMGYANLRLTKEKQNLQSNFQKLSVKTSKLTLKMEELELKKQKQLNQREDEHGKDECLLQQNVLLSKRLHNLLKKSEKLFKAHVIQQQAKSEKDELTPANSNDRIIEELNENLGFSKSNLETIENKLNEEEWKLNAALKHIRSVKEQIKIEF